MAPCRSPLSVSLLALALRCCSRRRCVARQGTLQVTAPRRRRPPVKSRAAPMRSAVEPDLGVTWLQPGTRFGTVQLEVRGTEREANAPRPHLRLAAGSEDGGYKWTFEGGDTYYAPAIGEYKFSNLTTPAVTFIGAALARGRSAPASASLPGAGRSGATSSAAILESLDQTILGGRVDASCERSPRPERPRFAHPQSRTSAEYTNTIAASDQAGGGVRYVVTSSMQVIADGSAVSVPPRRIHRARARWLRAGWPPLAAQPRMAPGQCVAVLARRNADAELAAARIARDSSSPGNSISSGELRVFGGWEAFRRISIRARRWPPAIQLPRNSGTRQFGGVRTTMRLALDNDIPAGSLATGFRSTSQSSGHRERYRRAGAQTGRRRFAR